MLCLDDSLNVLAPGALFFLYLISRDPILTVKGKGFGHILSGRSVCCLQKLKFSIYLQPS